MEWVEIEDDGNVYVNDRLLDEKYVKNKSLGEVDIEFPYQVKEDTYFVLGDQRKTSIDSRNSEIGSIAKENIIGKILFKVWPINRFGIVK
jgi:signal peptidase I